MLLIFAFTILNHYALILTLRPPSRYKEGVSLNIDSQGHVLMLATAVLAAVPRTGLGAWAQRRSSPHWQFFSVFSLQIFVLGLVRTVHQSEKVAVHEVIQFFSTSTGYRTSRPS